MSKELEDILINSDDKSLENLIKVIRTLAFDGKQIGFT
jgi:hypothetical protein